MGLPSVDISADRISVVLAVRHEFVRSAIGVLLANSTEIEVIGEARSATAAATLLAGSLVDVLVLDRRLPDGDSPSMIRRLRAVAPSTRIVVVAMARDTGFASAAIGAGAAGYVLKDTADAELVAAIVAVARGGCYVSRSVAERYRAQAQADRRELSVTSQHVLSLLARGVGESDIARSLAISTATVEAARAEIHRVLGVASRAELARYALRHGLLGERRGRTAAGAEPSARGRA